MAPSSSSSPQKEAWRSAATEIVTVGLPFCVFKVLTGHIALGAPPFVLFGYVLVALGLIDTVLNLVNLGSLVIARRRATGACLADVLFRRFGKENASDDLGLAVDVFVSFALVAVVIGGSLLGRLPRWALHIWDVAVVFNVLGAGVGRLIASLRRRDQDPSK